ncbi:hypothetical protein Ssed_2198 [Shewanella sediminis HAW-EB3]|uniref:Uncharacterized protein n=1 Tax=Shewanella sediminis (strain HAW-EB3) TaxID=425104 RepID=A8FVD4_SHESH|nr:hypothetical protein [Shewanella sediminis]ABV36807.1 hypothetical protein Ssed_2198 [Shewanella sediminis HAW-EB3]
MMPINQYGSTDSGLGGAWGGALDFLDLGLNKWAQIEQVNALKDSNPKAQNQLAEVDQQPLPVVHQPAPKPAETMVFGLPQKTVIAGFAVLLVVGLALRGKA